MTETELRDLLKLVRGIEHYIERCLRTEQEKNEDRVKKQLENSGVKFVDDEDSWGISDPVPVNLDEFEL